MIAEALGWKLFRLTCAEPRWTLFCSRKAVSTFVLCASPTRIMRRITGYAVMKRLESLQLESVLCCAYESENANAVREQPL